MIEKYFIEYCAPTLASIKTGNLFNISSSLNDDFYDYIEIKSSFFKEKGIEIFVLRENHKTLVYVYRAKKLARDLFDIRVKEFLESRGYVYNSIEEAIDCLRDRINSIDGFPHEIGLFLGYPLEDVLGFIENKGQNYKVCGHWKVYNDEKHSTRMFERFNKCKDVYLKQWFLGNDIYKLTVSA